MTLSLSRVLSLIDSHTPGVAIAALGWAFLLVFTAGLFLARFSRH